MPGRGDRGGGVVLGGVHVYGVNCSFVELLMGLVDLILLPDLEVALDRA